MQNLKPLDSLYNWAGRFESYLVANPEYRFSRHVTQIIKLDHNANDWRNRESNLWPLAYKKHVGMSGIGWDNN